MLSIALLWACTPSQREISVAEYYYPLTNPDTDGVMYVFQNVSDSLGAGERWRIRWLNENVLLSENVDADGQVILRQRERRVATGILMDSLVFFSNTKGLPPVQARIHDGNRLPFTVTDTAAVYLTHLEWWQPDDSLHLVLKRRRKFAGDTIWTWQGKALPALRFTTRDQLETERDGWTTSMWTGEEIYAKGIGLVYFRRDISTQFRLAFQLAGIE